jgi:hypothetical protein
MDELLKDGRTFPGKRYLLQKHKEPFTGEDFVEIQVPSPTVSLSFTARMVKNRSSKRSSRGSTRTLKEKRDTAMGGL